MYIKYEIKSKLLEANTLVCNSLSFITVLLKLILIIHQVKTNEIITVSEVWIPSLN